MYTPKSIISRLFICVREAKADIEMDVGQAEETILSKKPDSQSRSGTQAKSLRFDEHPSRLETR